MGSYKPPFTKKLARRPADITRMKEIQADREAQAAKRANPYYAGDVEEALRARTAEGHFVADDPATPEVNEAWEGGVAPESTVVMTMANLKTELTAAAVEMGISVDPKWNKRTILDAIEAAS